MRFQASRSWFLGGFSLSAIFGGTAWLAIARQVEEPLAAYFAVALIGTFIALLAELEKKFARECAKFREEEPFPQRLRAYYRLQIGRYPRIGWFAAGFAVPFWTLVIVTIIWELIQS